MRIPLWEPGGPGEKTSTLFKLAKQTHWRESGKQFHFISVTLSLGGIAQYQERPLAHNFSHTGKWDRVSVWLSYLETCCPRAPLLLHVIQVAEGISVGEKPGERNRLTTACRSQKLSSQTPPRGLPTNLMELPTCSFPTLHVCPYDNAHKPPLLVRTHSHRWHVQSSADNTSISTAVWFCRFGEGTQACTLQGTALDTINRRPSASGSTLPWREGTQS